MNNLDRFIKAQEKDFDKALKEIKKGKKQTHWMWYIFPQIHGLGRSSISKYYEIISIEEAYDYLDNNYLSKNLEIICQELINLNEDNPINIFGSIDSIKLKSSMTLFDKVKENDIYSKVLDKFYNGERDNLTLKIIGGEKKLNVSK